MKVANINLFIIVQYDEVCNGKQDRYFFKQYQLQKELISELVTTEHRYECIWIRGCFTDNVDTI